MKEDTSMNDLLIKNKLNNSAQIIINLFRIIKAMNIKSKLQSKCPNLYLISVDKVIDIEDLKANASLNAYVSGIVRTQNNQLETVSISKLYLINTTTTTNAVNGHSTSSASSSSCSQYALVASDVQLSFISISVVKAKSAKTKDPLGIVSFTICIIIY